MTLAAAVLWEVLGYYIVFEICVISQVIDCIEKLPGTKQASDQSYLLEEIPGVHLDQYKVPLRVLFDASNI